MILYVNGDEYTAAAKVANDCSFANDDFTKVALGRKPHPDNLTASWGMNLSRAMRLALICDAESAGSNNRILRTTQEFLRTLPDIKSNMTYIVIGWTSWEREEWYDEQYKEYVQISDVGEKLIPAEWQNRYVTYLKTVDQIEKQRYWHDEIWRLHNQLLDLKIPHLFFNTKQYFSRAFVGESDWSNCYYNPYDSNSTFIKFSESKKFKIGNGFYGSDAQYAWSNLLLSQLTKIKTTL